MDQQQFDDLTRLFAGGTSRRRAARWLLGAAVGLGLGGRAQVGQAACDEESDCCVCFQDNRGVIHCNPVSGGSCDDGDACTENDVCQNGVCRGTRKACASSNPCQVGQCDAATGQCRFANKPNQPTEGCDAPIPGGPCRYHTCRNGQCVSAPKADGTSCPSDDNACTDDVCKDGVCTHPARVTCDAPDNPCKTRACDPGSGQCVLGDAADGTTCPGGKCQAGQCVADPDPTPTCRTGFKRCDGKCVNPKTDERNCGRCGKRCRRGQQCRRGRCR